MPLVLAAILIPALLSFLHAHPSTNVVLVPVLHTILRTLSEFLRVCMKMSPRSERKQLRKKAQMLDEAIANGSIGSRVPASEPPRQEQLNVWLMYCATAAVQVGQSELSRQLTLHSVVCDPVQCIATTAVHNVLRSQLCTMYCDLRSYNVLRSQLCTMYCDRTMVF